MYSGSGLPGFPGYLCFGCYFCIQGQVCWASQATCALVITCVFRVRSVVLPRLPVPLFPRLISGISFVVHFRYLSTWFNLGPYLIIWVHINNSIRPNNKNLVICKGLPDGMDSGLPLVIVGCSGTELVALLWWDHALSGCDHPLLGLNGVVGQGWAFTGPRAVPLR